MAVDLNLPPAEDEEDDPFGGLPHCQDHPPLAGGHSMGDAYGAPYEFSHSSIYSR